MPQQSETSRDIVLFYPGEVLMEQVGAWTARNPDFKIKMAITFSVLPAGIRSAADSAIVAVIDATEHPAAGMSALRHVMTQLGPESIAFYTEVTHPLLEMFVRVRGSLLLLGPMSADEWDGFFEAMLSACRRYCASRRANPSWLGDLAELESA